MVNFSTYYLQNEGFRDKAKLLGLLASLALSSPLLSKPSESLFTQLARHEGVMRKPYVDTKGNLTVGIGFNLNDSTNKRILAKLGIKQADLSKGLSDQQIKSLFDESLKIAKADAMKFLPNLNSYPVQVQNAVIDMAFNLGLPKLNKFVEFKKSLQKRDFKNASHHMLDSLWAKQVGNRATYLASLVRSAK